MRGGVCVAAGALAVVLGLSGTTADPLPARFNVTTQQWFGGATVPLEEVFPELALPGIKAKRNVGVAFSGGGVRSFSLSFGYLRALGQLGLLDGVRYLSGVSGGSWATGVYTYYKRGAPGVAASDDQLLGNITLPADITLKGLRVIPAGCALKSVTTSLLVTLLKNLVKSDSDVWTRSISEIYLEPVGVDFESMFSLDAAHVAAIKAKNPILNAEPFVTALPGRPFLVVGTTVIGPAGISWLKASNRSFTMAEGTPLYFGRPHVSNVTFIAAVGAKDDVIGVGGFVEPFAMGSSPPLAAPGPVPASGDSVTVEVSGRPFYLADVLGASSFIAGGAIAALPVPLGSLEIEHSNWPVGTPDPVGTTMLYGDGGCIENLPVISLLRRRVASIVAFANFEAPMAGTGTWDPAKSPTDNNNKFIDNDITAYFGIGSGMDSDQFGFDLRRNQVFRKEAFVPLAQALQAAQAKGTGAIATIKHVTVANDWWGVPAGIEVDITWVYLSRLPSWEAQLPKEVRTLVVPKKNPSDPQSVPKTGAFKNFPHFDDFTQSSLTAEQATLLRDMAGWTVLENAGTFRAALG